MKQFTYNGVWWLPESPSAQVAGTLQFSKEEGLQLSLFGVLGEHGAIVGEKRIPIIVGAVWDSPLGEDVTLTGSWAKGITFGSVGLTREEYHVDRAFIGRHLENDQSFSFSHLKISLSGLSSWAHNYTGFGQKYITKTADHRAGFEIQWISPEPISGKIPGGDLLLGLGAKMSMLARDWSIKEQIGLSITVEQPQSADGLNAKYVYPLQNFLTLATDHPNALVAFSVRQPDSNDDIHVIGARVFDDTEAAEGLTPHKMIFSLNDVRDRELRLSVGGSRRQNGCRGSATCTSAPSISQARSWTCVSWLSFRHSKYTSEACPTQSAPPTLQVAGCASSLSIWSKTTIKRSAPCSARMLHLQLLSCSRTGTTSFTAIPTW